MAEKRLFGGIAIEKGYLTLEQLRHALAVQRERRERGEGHVLIGCLLVELGYLTREQVIDILAEHDRQHGALHGEGTAEMWRGAEGLADR
ncbi:MAG: hypothetical protein KatS3mg102_1112 [Planctomycetota bacterium]|nr:MAG: hypothetical protein KatS3mg102_1112 [Planctomycetota bacterium]